LADIRQQDDALAPGDKRLDPGHPEAWAPALLRELIDFGAAGLSRQGGIWAEWARERFRPESYLGAGSWNWQHMICACLLWLDPQTEVDFLGRTIPILDWWNELLAAQLGRQPLADAILDRFGGTETLSSTYEELRAGSVASLRLLALRFPDNPRSPEVLTLTGAYAQILSCLLALGAAPWWDRQGHVGAGNKPYYTGPTVSPVGERSTPAHAYQSDLGPFLALATGLPLETSKREDWPVEVCRQVAALDPTLGVDPGIAAACRALVAGDGSAAGTVVAALARVTLASRIEWLRWPEGVLALSGPRINLNTPKIFWSFADRATQTMQIGFPWQGGQHRGKGASTAPGSCEIRKRSDGRPYVIAQAEEGNDAERDLPASAPLYHVIGDASGMRMA
jgi:hypothetical protein